jgi:hypothetical protein
MRVDLTMRIDKVTPILIQNFSRNNIPGLDEAALLTYLKETFSLQELKRPSICARPQMRAAKYSY